jgi:hypothetical protein
MQLETTEAISSVDDFMRVADESNQLDVNDVSKYPYYGECLLIGSLEKTDWIHFTKLKPLKYKLSLEQNGTSKQQFLKIYPDSTKKEPIIISLKEINDKDF